MTLRSHLKYSIVTEHATEIAQTVIVCSPYNSRPISSVFAVGHDVSLLQIKKVEQTEMFGKAQRGI